MRFLTSVIAMLVMAGPAFAASVSKTPDPVMRCFATLSGVIEAGDTERVRAVIEDEKARLGREYGDPPDSFSPVLCLDSPGGSLAEGIKLAQMFRQTYTITAVGRGRRCESACAVAFLGGTANTYYQDTFTDGQMRRFLHPLGKLGFHAPSLTVPQGAYDEGTVGKAYTIALESMAKVQGLKSGLWIADSLIQTMLRTPPGEMAYLETVKQAMDWRVLISPSLSPEEMTADLALQACKNINAGIPSTAGFAARVTPPARGADIEITANSENYPDQRRVRVNETFRYPGDVPCSFDFVPDKNGKGAYVTSATLGQFQPITHAHFAKPATRLVALAKRDDARRETADFDRLRPRLWAEARCLVLRDGTVTSDDPCTLTREIGSNRHGDSYAWPSGAVTFVETSLRGGKTAEVNGNDASYQTPATADAATRTAMDAAAAGADWRCWLNSGSGNHFCVIQTGGQEKLFTEF